MSSNTQIFANRSEELDFVFGRFLTFLGDHDVTGLESLRQVPTILLCMKASEVLKNFSDGIEKQRLSIVRPLLSEMLGEEGPLNPEMETQLEKFMVHLKEDEAFKTKFFRYLSVMMQVLDFSN
jgi:hypothetical protein